MNRNTTYLVIGVLAIAGCGSGSNTYSPVVQGGVGTKAAIGAVFANYLLFFAGHIAALIRGRRMLVRQAARRSEQRPQATEREADERVCAICGKKQEDGADIRVCSCEKCGGVPRQLCLDHARNH